MVRRGDNRMNAFLHGRFRHIDAIAFRLGAVIHPRQNVIMYVNHPSVLLSYASKLSEIGCCCIVFLLVVRCTILTGTFYYSAAKKWKYAAARKSCDRLYVEHSRSDGSRQHVCFPNGWVDQGSEIFLLYSFSAYPA